MLTGMAIRAAVIKEQGIIDSGTLNPRPAMGVSEVSKMHLRLRGRAEVHNNLALQKANKSQGRN